MAPVLTVPALPMTQNGRQPVRAVGRDRRAQRAEIHLVVARRPESAGTRCHRGRAARSLSWPSCGSRWSRRQRVSACPAPCSPSRAHVEPGAGVPGHREADQVRDRAAAHQQPARLRREAEQLGHPAHHLPLHQRRSLVVPGEMRIHPRRQHVGQHRQRRPGAHDPAPEPGVNVAVGIGQDVLAELPVDLSRIGGPPRVGSSSAARGLRRHRLPHRPLAHRFEVVHHVVHHAVAERAGGRARSMRDREVSSDGGVGAVILRGAGIGRWRTGKLKRKHGNTTGTLRRRGIVAAHHGGTELGGRTEHSKGISCASVLVTPGELLSSR